MLKTVFFDLDDTLLDFHKAEAEALSGTLRELDIEPTPEAVARYSAINAAQWRLLEAGEITREQLLTRRFSLLFAELSVERSSRLAQSIYEKRLSAGHYFIPGAPGVLEALAPRYDLYLVSNGNAVVQDGRLKSAGISHYFKDIFISERVGFDKPRPEFFRRCFDAIPGFSPASAIIIGDSLTSDIQGGRDAGILTCWFNPHGQPRRADLLPDYEIVRLDQIPGLLEEIPEKHRD